MKVTFPGISGGMQSTDSGNVSFLVTKGGSSVKRSGSLPVFVGAPTLETARALCAVFGKESRPWAI
jgi:hypothetical protein